ncbi:MAG: DegT/DnrJ/EryC1/StrS family aminotransferase [Neisseriales bacterium]|nr:MAG: DegT/DnrJ/EryC1/StrS family aminotransferase [Neisseriales bacterium]
MSKIKYSLASSTWDEKELASIQRVIDSGNYSMGNEVIKFEQEFAKFTGSKYCVMVNSGSSANLIMTAALFYRKENKLQPGDEVIVPAVSWPTTFYPLAQYGLKLKFVDIDKNTLNYDLNALKAAVSEKTRLLMVVNLLGNPNDFAQINEIIANKNITLIEDNCESMGALFQAKQAGTFGVMGSFSTFFSHHMATMEGGMVVTDDEELYHILLSLRAHGWTRNLPKFNHVCGEKSDDPFEESFRFVLPGYNVRPIEMEAAVGLEQLKKLPSFIQERRNNAIHFQKLFENHPDFYIQQEIGSSSWFGFSFVIKESSKLTRKEVAKKLMEAGIECRPIVAGNFAKNEVMKYFNYEIHGELTNAELIDRNGLFVGNHQFDISQQIDYLVQFI